MSTKTGKIDGKSLFKIWGFEPADGLAKNLKEIQIRVCKATDVSLRSLQRILNRQEQLGVETKSVFIG